MANTDQRRNDLAKIHMAKKALCLDDETYRAVIREIGGSKTGSSADLSPTGRAKVLRHFVTKGWKPKHAPNPGRNRASASGDALASGAEVRLIRSLWIQMADAGTVRDRSEQALRRWVMAATRRYHDKRTGFSAPEFLPGWVAQRVIEHLKAWANRAGCDLHE